jgi:hypothetical protein
MTRNPSPTGRATPKATRSPRAALLAALCLALAALAPACGGDRGGLGQDDSGTADDGGGGSDTILNLPDAALPQQDAAPPQQDAAMHRDSAPLPDAGYYTIPLSACYPEVYTATTTIGNQNFDLLIDTGSTTLGVAATGCSCGGVSPVYSSGATAVDQHQTCNSQYASGQWSGEIYADDVSLVPGPTASTKFAAIRQQQNFFTGSMCYSPSGAMQGILGMGPAASAVTGTDGFFDRLVATGQVKNEFAVWLCDNSGTMWLGGYDPAATTAAPQYVPSSGMIGTYYYAVDLVSITVNGTTVPVASGQYPQSIVDTGTSEFILGATAYTAITAAIQADTRFTQVFGPNFFPAANAMAMACASVTASKAQLDAEAPSLTLNFGTSPSFSVVATASDSYLSPFTGQWCSTLYGATQSMSSFPFASIMGAPVQRSAVVIFDRANSRVGFAPHAPCP